MVDIDGTLGDFVTVMSTWTARHMGITGLHDPDTYDFSRDASWHDAYPTRGSFLTALTMAAGDGLYGMEPVLDGMSPSVITQLHDEGNRILIVTNRVFHDDGIDGRVRMDTMQWLDEHGYEYDDLILTGDKTSIPADVVIEDSPDNITMALDAGRRVVRIPHPYNEKSGGDRMENWNEDTILNGLS